MKTYEQERDEAANEHKEVGGNQIFIEGADWANSRAQKMITKKDFDIKKLSKINNEWVDEIFTLGIKIISRDATIEKMKACFEHILVMGHLKGSTEAWVRRLLEEQNGKKK